MSESGYGSVEEIIDMPLTRFVLIQERLDKKMKKRK
jgi:hypothetical protein